MTSLSVPADTDGNRPADYDSDYDVSDDEMAVRSQASALEDTEDLASFEPRQQDCSLKDASFADQDLHVLEDKNDVTSESTDGSPIDDTAITGNVEDE